LLAPWLFGVDIFPQVRLRIAQFKIQNRPAVRKIGEQTKRLQLVVKTALRQQKTVLVKGISLAAFTGPGDSQFFSAFSPRSHPQTQDGNDLVRLAANRGRHIHHGEARLEPTLVVCQQPRTWERTRDGRLPGEGLVQKLLVNEEGFFANVLVVVRRQNAMLPVGQKKPLIPLNLERRLQIIPELGELRGIYQNRIGRSLLLR